MTDLFLIFLAAAYLDNLVLARLFDAVAGASETKVAGRLVAAGLLLVLATTAYGIPQTTSVLPVQSRAYLHALAFVLTAMAVSPAGIGESFRQAMPRLSKLRRYLPLLVANVAVLVFVLLDDRPDRGLREAAVFCLGASLAFHPATILLSALRERIEESNVPQPFRGMPIIVLTACLVALAMMGCFGALPW